MHADTPRLPARDPRGHKGTFGTVTVVGGCAASPRMIGAPAFAARAALRAGCGLVRLAMPEPILDAGLLTEPHATGIPLAVDDDGLLVPHEAVAALDAITLACDCLAIGPGLGAGAGVGAVALRAVQQDNVPVVVDADALNALALLPDLNREFRGRAIITPHPGEYARLARALNLDHDPVDPPTRPAAAEALAQRLGCIVVLKGAGTIVSDGQRTWLCGRGNPCLATAGTGDVLTGCIASLVAQFLGKPSPAKGAARGHETLDLWNLACLGVEAHARAGEAWADQNQADAGMLALQLADCLILSLGQLREQSSVG